MKTKQFLHAHPPRHGEGETRRWGEGLFLFLFLFIFIASTAMADGPEPDPWWMQVDKTQALALKWLASLTVIFGALATFVVFIVGKVNEIKGIVERQGTRVDSQQEQLHSIALNTRAPAAPVPTTPLRQAQGLEPVETAPLQHSTTPPPSL